MAPDEKKIRISNAEREEAVARLQKALDEGRIELGEFDERSLNVYQAKTAGELQELFDDLPNESRAMDRSVHSIELTSEEIAEREAAKKRDDDDDSGVSGIWIAWMWVTFITVGVWGISSVASWSLQNFWPIWPVGILTVIAVAITVMDKLDKD